MQSTTHTNTRNAGTVVETLARRWPALAFGICALVTLAILVISAGPVGAALQHGRVAGERGAHHHVPGLFLGDFTEVTIIGFRV